MPATAVAFAALSWATLAQAQSDPLQAQVDALIEKVAELERKQHLAAAPPSAAPSSDAVTGGATKGSFKLPGSNTSVTLGGYVKLDAIFTNPSAGAGSTADQELEAPNIPVGANAKSGERNQVKLHARQSRLFGDEHADALGRTHHLRRGRLRVGRQRDREQSERAPAARLRHARRPAGRPDLTTFSIRRLTPETPTSAARSASFARQAQVRWTQPFSGGRWSSPSRTERSRPCPRTSCRRPLAGPRGQRPLRHVLRQVLIAGIARQLRIDSPSAPATRQQKLATAFGANGVIPSFGKDDLRLSAYAGNGIGRYSTGFLSDALVDADSHLVAPTQWLAMAAYRHFWTEKVS
jgi:hypothetical protein